MNKDERDRKRRRKALDRVSAAAQLFENEIIKAQRQKGYSPDLDDLESLARFFEGAAKALAKLNQKAVRQNRVKELIKDVEENDF